MRNLRHSRSLFRKQHCAAGIASFGTFYRTVFKPAPTDNQGVGTPD